MVPKPSSSPRTQLRTELNNGNIRSQSNNNVYNDNESPALGQTNAVPALKLNNNSAKNLIMRYEVNTVRDDGLPQRSNKALFGQS